MSTGIFICRTIPNDHSFGVFYGSNPLEFSFPLLLLELSSIIIISRIVRYILKPLRQPKVVSQIIGGIILGPSALSRSKKFRAYMFPDHAQYVIQNLAVIGFMYFLFVTGVKMDITQIRKAGKKHWYIAVVGVMVPLFSSAGVAFLQRNLLGKGLQQVSSIWGVTSSLAMTGFPVLYPIMKELNLLSSEIGRIALSIALVGDLIGNNGVTIFEASKQGEQRPIAALWYMISLIVVLALIFGGLRQAMIWIIRTTPVGKPVDQIYVIAILLGVMVIGFVADFFGLAIANGPLWLGLAVPEGPPLGAILVEKSETILTDIIMPFSYIYVGMIVDFSSLANEWSNLKPLILILLAGYFTKAISTLITARLCGMTFRDSITLCLILTLRGEVELLLMIHWMDFEMIGQPEFTIMVLSTIVVTGVNTALVSILHDPLRPYMVNSRRTIQHSPANTEHHIVACIHDEENLYGLMKLLELSNPTVNSPFYVHALCLIEIVGQAHPLFIDHEKEKEEGVERCRYSSVHNALKIFQEAKGEYIKMHSYTAIAYKRSMYMDICELALSKQACLIILPLHKRISDSLTGTNDSKQGPQSISANVLENAPCSVGILVDKSPYQSLVTGVSRSSLNNFVVLFLGGPDSREALSFADQAAGNPDISLTVIRFLAFENVGDNAMEKKLDDQLVTWFWVKNEGNDRVVYREAVVKNGEETIAVIQAMNNECYDLWIVGRNQRINPILLQGLSNWSEDTELGVMGEYIASVDFGSRASVLVLQQQVLRCQTRRDPNSLASILIAFFFGTN